MWQPQQRNSNNVFPCAISPCFSWALSKQPDKQKTRIKRMMARRLSMASAILCQSPAFKRKCCPIHKSDRPLQIHNPNTNTLLIPVPDSKGKMLPYKFITSNTHTPYRPQIYCPGLVKGYFSSRTSFSFAAERSSIFLVSEWVSFSSSSSERFFSSSLIFFSFSSFSMASFRSRRMLRTAVR